jgi:glycosyltransferase involved in cell wall biosynthesis
VSGNGTRRFVHSNMATVPFAASLVIPTYNRKSELRELLHSGQRQTVPLEILVMDDGSTDGTLEMVKSQFPKIALHQEDAGRGPTLLRNRGVEKASCNIVFSLDNDTVFVAIEPLPSRT